MADLLTDYKKQKTEWELKVRSELPLEYVKKEAAEQYDFLCCVEIPWPLLRQWCDLFEETSGADVNYIDLLNATVADRWFCLKRGNERVDELLRKRSHTVRATYKKTTGRKKKELDGKVYSLCVRKGEMESVELLKTEALNGYKKIEEWRKKYADLENEKKETV